MNTIFKNTILKDTSQMDLPAWVTIIFLVVILLVFAIVIGMIPFLEKRKTMKTDIVKQKHSKTVSKYNKELELQWISEFEKILDTVSDFDATPENIKQAREIKANSTDWIISIFESFEYREWQNDNDNEEFHNLLNKMSQTSCMVWRKQYYEDFIKVIENGKQKNKSEEDK